MKPIVAIIGRPNVGKSTLFNRIIRKKDALVDDVPGVTRDRHYAEALWDDIPFSVIDTGGFIENDDDAFADLIRKQVMHAIQEADAIVFVMDGKGGISPFDADIYSILRTVSRPIFYVVNKIDGIEKEDNLYEFYNLGIETLYSLSAEHGYGVPDFLTDLVAVLPKLPAEENPEIPHIAVVGRPNVGKSSLINRLLGQERLLISNVPGTTRDAIDSICHFNRKPYLLIDTAGIRRKKKVSDKLEKFSIIKSLRSLDRCHVALILIDADEGITDQDIKIAGYAYERGCGCIFLLNKWDLVEKDKHTAKRFYDDLSYAAKFLNFAPMMTISALTGLRVGKVFGLVDEVHRQFTMRISTGQINKILNDATTRTEPSLHKGKRLKFYYASQVSTSPPTFVLFVNYPSAVHFSYKRYLINQIREIAGLDKTPLRIIFRQRTGKIDFAARKGKRNSFKSQKKLKRSSKRK